MTNERTVALFDEFVSMVRGFIERNVISHAEYEAVMKYVISVGEAGEWPLWFDAFFETAVDAVNYGRGEWTSSAILGPYFKEGAPLLTEQPYTLPMRPDEPGERMLFAGQISDPDGTPIPGALLDVWHSTNDGVYTFFSPALPDEYLLRAKIRSDGDGKIEFRSILPVPYEIPKNGPTGYLMNDVLGRHSWRPAHIHFRVAAEGYKPLTTQLYFEGDPYLSSDSCSAVKPDLILPVEKTEIDGNPTHLVTFDFLLQPTN